MRSSHAAVDLGRWRRVVLATSSAPCLPSSCEAQQRRAINAMNATFDSDEALVRGVVFRHVLIV